MIATIENSILNIVEIELQLSAKHKFDDILKYKNKSKLDAFQFGLKFQTDSIS